MRASRLPAIGLGCALALGTVSCAGEPIVLDPPPLNPIDRTAVFGWSTASSDPLHRAALLDALATDPPRTLVLAGGLGAFPELDPLDGSSAASRALAELALAAPELPVGVELGALGADPPPICFSGDRPATDPTLAARREAVRSWLRAHPGVDDLWLTFERDAPAWDAHCSCSPCEGDSPTARARRLTAAYSALEEATSVEGATLWWGSGGPREGDATLPAWEAMEAALDALQTDPSLPVWSPGTRGTDSVWAADDPLLDQAALRRTVADVDLTGGRFGAVVAPVVFPDALFDLFRRQRRQGVVGWLARVDGPHRSAFDGLRAVMPAVYSTYFTDLTSTPPEAVRRWCVERFGLDVEDPAADELADLLRATGPALAIASHPLGVPPRDLALGLPGAFPVEWGDPAAFEPAWSARRDALLDPDLAALAAVHQAGAEGLGLARDARAALDRARPALQPDDEAALEAALDALEPAVEAWGLAVLADATRRAWQREADEETAAWLRGDADALDRLAARVEALGRDVFPADPARLRALAAQLRAELGDGPAATRPFPVLSAVRHEVEGDRVVVRWAVEPSAGGSVQWGSRWPVYDDGGDRDDAPAATWQAFRRPVAADTRLTYRVCAHLDGLDVCSSDRVLWTPR